MAKLSKLEIRNHNKALSLLEKDVLSADDKEFVFEHYHEGATHMNSQAGAFFTPLGLARDLAIDAGGDTSDQRKFIDMCAGIGVLAYALVNQFPLAKVVCVEINKEYYDAGKKLVPEAEWHCMDITDLEALRALGRFHTAVSNPPFGAVATFKDSVAPIYSGSNAEFKVIDIACEIANDGVFIIPQTSAGFELSGKPYARNESDKYLKFEETTGIKLEHGMGIDTLAACDTGWKQVDIVVEIAHAVFPDRRGFEVQPDMFAA